MSSYNLLIQTGIVYAEDGAHALSFHDFVSTNNNLHAHKCTDDDKMYMLFYMLLLAASPSLKLILLT